MNEGFEIFLEIVKYIIPALITFLVCYTMLKQFFDNEQQKRLVEMKATNSRTMEPLRLQAYERLILLMERLSPENLVLRVHKPGISATQLKVDLINEINTEFNHNISQQLFVSVQCWQVIRTVKEEMVNIINTAYADLGNNAVGLDLSKTIFETIIKMEEVPTHKALIFLKKEFDIMFG